MALIKCPECGKENVSDSAQTCPNCGYGIKTHYEKIALEQQKIVQEEKINTSKKKVVSVVNNPKVIIPTIIIIGVIIISVFIYQSSHKEVIHGITWGMSISEVQKKEANGYYNDEDNYYAVSNVDFFGKDSNILYIFEGDKLASITAIATGDTYDAAYNIAYNICKEHNLPISFEDKTDSKYLKSSILTWNIDGTTIKLVGTYDDRYSQTYTFLLTPYDGNDYGEDYKEKGVCSVGSETFTPCQNEISPWNSGDNCYEHGCYVIGCPESIYPKYDYNTILCNKHFFLSEQ